VVNADSEQLQAELAARGLELGDAVSVSHIIAAASDRVWQVISQPGQLTRYHPFCQATTVIKWPGVGAKDTVTYYSGIHYERDFVTWIEGVGFDIEVGPPPHKTARVEWRITELGEHQSELASTVVPVLKSGRVRLAEAGLSATVFWRHHRPVPRERRAGGRSCGNRW
jgi:polyketide cyclase/dehydrase/lipid transport protein